MASIKQGDVIKDNDPRRSGRLLVVEGVDCRYAYCRSKLGQVKARILLNRVHTDSKQRRSGFSLVREDK